MGQDYLSILVLKFFEGNFSPEIQQKFRCWLIQNNESNQKEAVLTELWNRPSPEADADTYTELQQLHRRIGRHRQVTHHPSFLFYLRRIAAVILLPLLGAFGCYYYIVHLHPEKINPEMVECFVPYGERKLIILADQSEVWVNSGSLLVYEKEFKGNTRTLYLSGEANFKVTKNPNKPFIVKTEHMEIEALGTTFDVQSYPDARQTIAALEEGKIKVGTVGSKKRSFILKPNEQLIYNHASGNFVYQKINAVQNARWKQGYLIFQSVDFEKIARTLERRFQVTINYEASRYIGRTFSMKFSPGEELDQILSVMQKTIGFKYKIEKNIINITD